MLQRYLLSNVINFHHSQYFSQNIQIALFCYVDIVNCRVVIYLAYAPGLFHCPNANEVFLTIIERVTKVPAY